MLLDYYLPFFILFLQIGQPFKIPPYSPSCKLFVLIGPLLVIHFIAIYVALPQFPFFIFFDSSSSLCDSICLPIRYMSFIFYPYFIVLYFHVSRCYCYCCCCNFMLIENCLCIVDKLICGHLLNWVLILNDLWANAHPASSLFGAQSLLRPYLLERMYVCSIARNLR